MVPPSLVFSPLLPYTVPMRLILLGDSFTQGYGVDPGKAWGDQMMIPDWEIINRGLNGDTTYTMDLRFMEDVVDYLPDRVLITGGINDLIVGSDVYDVVSFYADMILTSREFGIQPVIGLEPPIDPGMAGIYWLEGVDYYRIAREQYRLTKALRQLAEDNGLSRVDFFRYLGRLKASRPAKNYYLDGLHLTAEAHNLLARFAQDMLKAIPFPE